MSAFKDRFYKEPIVWKNPSCVDRVVLENISVQLSYFPSWKTGSTYLWYISGLLVAHVGIPVQGHNADVDCLGSSSWAQCHGYLDDKPSRLCWDTVECYLWKVAHLVCPLWSRPPFLLPPHREKRACRLHLPPAVCKHHVRKNKTKKQTYNQCTYFKADNYLHLTTPAGFLPQPQRHAR